MSPYHEAMARRERAIFELFDMAAASLILGVAYLLWRLL